MKITLIGGKGSGKTYFKYGFLHKMFSYNASEFSIKENDEKRFILKIKENLEEQLMRDENSSLESTPDNDFRLKNCVLRYKGEKILLFDLIDPRGESFKVIAYGDEGEEDLTNIIKESNALIIFVDAVKYKLYLYTKKKLKNPGVKFKEVVSASENESILRDIVFEFEQGITRLATTIEDAITESNCKKKIIFVLSKCDSEFIEKKDIDILKSNIGNLYGLDSHLLKEDYEIFDICAVGRGNVTSNFIKGTFKEKISKEKGFKFTNVLSVFFRAVISYANDLNFNLSELKNDQEKLNSEINELEVKKNSKQDLRNEYERSLESLKQDTDKLVDENNQLEKDIDDYSALYEDAQRKVNGATIFFQKFRKQKYAKLVDTAADYKTKLELATSNKELKEEKLKSNCEKQEELQNNITGMSIEINSLEENIAQKRNEQLSVDEKIKVLQNELLPITKHRDRMCEFIGKGE